MKKLVLATMMGLTLAATGSAFAAGEAPVQVVQFNGVIVKNIAGEETGITGANGGVVTNGALNVDEDGSFTTTTSVVLEHHLRDTTDANDPHAIMADLVPGTDWTVTQLQYFINGTPIASSDITLNDSGTAIATMTAGTLTSSVPVGTLGDDSSSTLNLSVTGEAPTNTAELDTVTPGVNPVAVYATVTAKPSV